MIKWIDAKKELPDDGIVVLIHTIGRHFDVAYLIGEGTAFGRHWEDGGSGLYWMCHVTHWAHINAPESEGENG